MENSLKDFIVQQHCDCHTVSVTHGVKLARFCRTFAVRVRVRSVLGSGYGWVSPNREGLRMAGQRKRRNKDAEMRRYPISARPRSSQSDTQLEKILFSSFGKELQETDDKQTITSLYHLMAHTHRTAPLCDCNKEYRFPSEV